jgi:hypothetical protein
LTHSTDQITHCGFLWQERRVEITHFLSPLFSSSCNIFLSSSITLRCTRAVKVSVSNAWFLWYDDKWLMPWTLCLQRLWSIRTLLSATCFPLTDTSCFRFNKAHLFYVRFLHKKNVNWRNSGKILLASTAFPPKILSDFDYILPL